MAGARTKRGTSKASPRRQSTHSGSPAKSLPAVAVSTELPWYVSPEQIARSTDEELKRLMRSLLHAEAYRAGADLSKVLVNNELKAADDGSDAESPPPATTSVWLGPNPTCWQFKAGVAGRPERLRGEAAKRRPVEILKAGGRFAVVASGSKGGHTDIRKRLAVLTSDARRMRAPTSKIDVLTSDQLSTWVNEHPPIAFSLHSISPNVCTLEGWTSFREHRNTWCPSPGRQRKLEQIRSTFDAPMSGESARHMHIYGRAGVGKTRLALEACRGASWGSLVVYAPASDPRVASLIDGVVQSPCARVVLVVDDVLPEDVRRIAGYAQRGDGRVRLITIGHDSSPDEGSILPIEVEPLEPETMTEAVRTWHPDMPRERISYVVQLADGFVRLAQLAAQAVAKDPGVDTASLLRRGDIRQLFDRMLGPTAERRALHVVAVLTSVGWNGAREVEGRAIAAKFGLDWSTVRTTVNRLHTEKGVAPMAGDLRYISPAPLGTFLALEAWEADPALLRELFDVLPSEQARRAYNERLRAVVVSPEARELAERELGFFCRWESFLEGGVVDRWSALAGANPALAAANARAALADSSDDERRQIVGPARRQLVRGLCALAWHQVSFHDAAFALAELAAAENEAWVNNATGEFGGLFQVHVARTACPYLDRLSVLDELLARPRSFYPALAISALARAGQDELGIGGGPTEVGPPEEPWQPRTWQDQTECFAAALDRLQGAASLSGVDDALLRAAERTCLLLRVLPVRDKAAAFIRAVTRGRADAREKLRQEIHRLINGERKHWKTLGEEDLRWMEALHAELEDRSQSGRLRRLVGHPAWGEERDELVGLAGELVLDPAPLLAEWSWLTSGQAGRVWDLGEALARADDSGRLLAQLAAAPNRGPDPRLVSAYVAGRSSRHAPGWIDDWIDKYESDHPDDIPLVFDVTWRCAATSRGAARLERLLREGRLQPGVAASLSYGAWTAGPSIESLTKVLDALLTKGADRGALLELVEHRLSKHPQDLSALEDVAMMLLTDPSLVRRGQMTSYYWDQLARRLLGKRTREIASAIFAAQANRDRETWFVQHSQAAVTLEACVKSDPRAVWEALSPHLEEGVAAHLFAVGFPPGILGQLPHEAILDWVRVDPRVRANVVARMTSKRFDDESLGAKILDRFGSVEGVSDTFFSAFISGVWVGEASRHWTQLAERLETSAKQTALPGVRRWAREGARSLRRMATVDRKREAERKVRFP